MQNQLLAILPMVLIFVVFYFLLIRPQNKKQKERVKMLSVLKKGDKVVTIGGMHGSIVELTEDRVTLKVNDSTRLTFERSAINAVNQTAIELDDLKGKQAETTEEKKDDAKVIKTEAKSQQEENPKQNQQEKKEPVSEQKS